MLSLASLVFAGTPATSVWPLDGLAATGGQLFQPQARTNGNAVSTCNGESPVRNACSAPLDDNACRLRACWPNVQGGLAYTGTITAYVYGKDRLGAERYVAWSCSFLANSATTVGGVTRGGCSGTSNAPYECNQNPLTGKDECGNYLWPPFRLAGVATPPVSGTAPLGTWTTSVQRE